MGNAPMALGRAKSSGRLFEMARTPSYAQSVDGSEALEKLSRQLAAVTTLVQSQNDRVNEELGTMGGNLGSLSKKVESLLLVRQAELRAAAARLEGDSGLQA